ncbi:alpha/beta hydrolase family protein [Leifsonia sp. NPDC058230]|uniref:alpha/beta hydrolase family protein n=1 Tax=Leifsonia sp. NPDC058230 TaxID=3346391 RepID=UPI0036DF9B7B
MSVRELRAIAADGVVLAGSLWAPDAPVTPPALLAMHPGSGASDRDNDVLFPPIREAVLQLGVAVCTFDKRGVGGSGGSWLTADIETQAADLAVGAAAALDALFVVGEAPVPRFGLFGHSQGGWVALAAAERTGADFVITNSGPGVTPRDQESYSTRTHLDRLELVAERETAAAATFDEFMLMLSDGVPFAEAEAWMRDPSRRRAFEDLADAGAFVPDSEDLWAFAATIIDYDPAESLQRLRVPLLALFGALDAAVPVDVSAERFRALVPPGLLSLRVIAEGDHRIQVPGTDTFAPGYLESLTAFVAERLPS